VDSRISAYLRRAAVPIQSLPVNLDDVLRAAVGSDSRADFSTAERIGSFFLRCKAIFEPNSSYMLEVHRLAATLALDECTTHP
jgi:hypothetical protein